MEIHEPSSWVADSEPRISLSDELVIWMSSTAMKAPSMPAATASQVRPETFSSITGNAGGFASVVEGLLMEA
ncbi:hypothetical protein D3C87_880120 [compost metagenome]